MRMPESLGRRLDQVSRGMTWLKQEGTKRVPDVVKELDQKLREVQSYIRSGGETTSRTVRFEVATGETAHTYTDEARLLEEGPLPVRSARGGWKQNPGYAAFPEDWASYYKHEPGYPDLSAWIDEKTGLCTNIAANSGRMTNRVLTKNERIVRFFGPGETVNMVKIHDTSAGGYWWWLGEAPVNAKQWREQGAVLDEWNRDGFVVIGHMTQDAGPKVVTGTIAEQLSSKLPGQYLPGGAQQAFLDLSSNAKGELQRLAYGVDGKGGVVASGKPARWVDPESGIAFEIRPTGWKDANGVHGFDETSIPGTVQTKKLQPREQTTNIEETSP
jgi:hypothetical protein